VTTATRTSVLLVLGLGLVGWTGAGAQGTVPQAPASATTETSEGYQGEEAERFLTRARITRVQGMSEGVTAPRRMTLELDGVTRTAVFKTINEERPGITQLNTGQVEVNFVDTWRTEVAAYIVDRMISLGLVPATVEREYRGQSGSLQWWVEAEMPEAQRVRDKVRPPDSLLWSQQMLTMELFDNLIYNTDRHLNNILVTKTFELRLIDHSRAFRTFPTLRPDHTLTRFSKSLLAGIGTLERDALRARIGRYVSASRIDALLQRRDAIVALAAKLVAERGEDAVLFP
jgi:hypothetical protein